PVKVSYYAPDDEQEALILIVDQGAHRVLAVDQHSKVQWQYGKANQAGSLEGFLNGPMDLQWTDQDTCLIADTGNDRVLEVQRSDGQLLKILGPDLGLSGPTHAQRLLDGQTLIVDAGNYRVLELDEAGDVVTECFYF